MVVVCGLAGALTATSYKWGFFVLGVAALFYIWSVYIHYNHHSSIILITLISRTVLLFHGPRTTFNAGAGVRSGYVRGAGFVAFFTMLYPIAWGCSEGGNLISPTHEMIWYGILDLILGPLFLYYFVWGLRNVDYGLFGLHSGKYTDGPYGTAGTGYGQGALGGTRGVGTGPNMTTAGPGATATRV